MESVRAVALTIVLALGLAPRGTLAADATLAMAPSSKWAVDYAADQACRVSHEAIYQWIYATPVATDVAAAAPCWIMDRLVVHGPLGPGAPKACPGDVSRPPRAAIQVSLSAVSGALQVCGRR